MTNLSVVHAARHPTEDGERCGHNNPERRGSVSADLGRSQSRLQGKRLNTHPLFTGTDLAVGLERIGAAFIEKLPTRVYFFRRVEPLILRLLKYKPKPFDSLALQPTEEEGFMGWAQTVTLPKPGNKKGTATIFCSTNTKGKAPAPFVTSVAAGAVHMTTTKTKPEVSAEFPTPHSATPAKLTVTPQSQTTQDYWTSAPLDPDPVFEVLLPGGEADLNTYLTAYIAEVAEVLEVPADGLANDFQGAYGYALNPAIGNRSRARCIHRHSTSTTEGVPRSP